MGYALRTIVAGVCCLGIWSSWVLARADYLFKQDTEASVRSAIGLEADGWAYYMRLAQFDPAHARELLTTSLRLNRYDAQANIELGLEYEAEGDFARAEKQLLEAYAVDHTYLPRWSLANYYFRRDNMPAFWSWARSAAQMPADDVGGLFELCWHASPDAKTITAALLNEKPELLRQYIGFLLSKDQAGEAALVAPHLVAAGDAESDRGLMFNVIDRLVAANDAGGASGLWRLLIQRQWVVADATVPNNAGFHRDPLPVSFDWSLPEYQGLHSWPGPSGLETEFAGTEPEDCVVAEQAAAVKPGDYTMRYEYRTTEIGPGTGLRWKVLDAKSNAMLGESADLSSEATRQAEFGFSVPAGTSFIRLRLAYRRALGTPRVSGTLLVLSTEIEAGAKT